MSQQTLDYSRPERRNRLRRLLASRRIRRVLGYALIVLVCYVGSYVGLSIYGIYEPAVIGLNGVKWYDWAPAGFVKDYRHRMGLYYLYMPLFIADRNVWHRPGDAYSGKYPVHVPRNVNDVYAAWKRSSSFLF